MKMSKRHIDSQSRDWWKCQEEAVFPSIVKKVELLWKIEKGASVKRLSDEYGVSNTTIYDLKKQKAQLLEFYGDSEMLKFMEKWKSLHQPKILSDTGKSYVTAFDVSKDFDSVASGFDPQVPLFDFLPYSVLSCLASSLASLSSDLLMD